MLFNKTDSQEKVPDPVQLSHSRYEKRIIKSDTVSGEIDETIIIQDNHQLLEESTLEKTEEIPEKKENVEDLKEKIVALEHPKTKK